MTTFAQTVLNDASSSGAGASWKSNDAVYIWLGEHYGTLYSCAGWHLKINAANIPSDTADITAASLTIRRNNSTGISNMTVVMLTDVGSTMPWSDAASNRPVDDYAAAKAENGYVGWDIPSGVAGDYHESPDLSSLLASAIDNSSGPVDGYYYIAVICSFDSALDTANAVSAFQCRSIGNATEANRPTFELDSTPDPVNASVTTTAPTATASISEGSSLTELDVDYDYDSSRVGGRRYLDLYEPLSTPPAEGRPLIVFLHGGAFVAGSENDLRAAHARVGLTRGYAVASVRYSLSDYTGADNVYTHPMATQDIGAALTFLTDEYDIDEDSIILTSYSAGGHLVLEYALTYDDGTTYDWTYTGPAADTRNSAPPNTSPEFTFTQGRTGLPKPKGVFMWAGPVDLTRNYADNPFIRDQVRGYLGGTSDETFNTADVEREADLNYLITGAAGADSVDSIWEGNPHADRIVTIPIGYIEGRYGPGGFYTEDDPEWTVPPEAGVVALGDAMGDAGLHVPADYDGTALGLQEVGGLSHYIHKIYGLSFGETPHDYIYIYDDFTDFTEWLEWLEEYVVAEPTAPTATAATGTPSVSTGTSESLTTTAPTASASTGTPTVTAVTDASATTTAPTATATAPSPTVTAVSSDSVTTTAPTAAAAAGTVDVAATSNASIATVAPTAAAAAGTVDVTAVSDAAVTTTAPTAAAAVGTATVEAVSDATAAITAPTAAAAVTTPGTATGSSQAVTITAPTAAAAVGTPTVTAVSIATVAPTAAAAVGTATVEAVSDASVTTTAPTAAAAAGTVDVAADGNASVTTTAPTAAAAVGTATVEAVSDASVTTTAPTAAAAAGTVDVAADGNASVTTTAPTAAAAVGTATVEAVSDASVTTTAPTAAAAAGTVDVAAGSTAAVTSTAPTAAAAAGTATVTVQYDATVTIIAAIVTATVGTPTTVGTGSLAHRSGSRIRRPDFTRGPNREATT